MTLYIHLQIVGTLLMLLGLSHIFSIASSDGNRS
jgi:hypothetical protein